MTDVHENAIKLAKDLSKEPPRSPRIRIGGFCILARAIDKCRAYLANTLGEYSHGCPVDMILLDAKRVELADFREFVATGADDEAIGAWFRTQGRDMDDAEIEEWNRGLEQRGLFERLEASDAEDFPNVCNVA